ncbi:DUF3370 domain-containing protein [Oscillatoria sp. FACHB-1407]|uniref:DUF3370 domain-containing protein n=1 Tax=Oscillatoria sp. FACHB-1407 TaxID=2692847 RepID=UPI001685770A|nr:DUF3370 domain-containing protein [Oscillatoria sp. FACHB-1407]MBD2464832.1 DUF3370 domain-containing protein [Oscillatoria sp. FACHB-1407]
MFAVLSLLTLAQATSVPTPVPTPTPTPQEIVRPQQVRPLPGQLDAVPVFNSNSPELVGNEGILLSTFPPQNRATPAAHLNFPFSGRFDVFAHHVFRAIAPDNLTSLYLGIILYNPGNEPVTVDVLQAASYLSQPDAPFIQLPPVVDNPLGTVYAGPGSRVTSDILRGERTELFPAQVVVPPGGYEMLLNLPIPVATLDPPLNGRSTLMRLRSSDTVYAASLALLARLNPDGTERAPNLEEWQALLNTGELSTPRDRTPTPPGAPGNVIYSRVAGVALGSRWNAQVTDNPTTSYLTIPAVGEAFSYGLSTLVAGRLGTEQNQTAEMLVRYPDTAYQAHGNYGIQYDLALPLQNSTDQTQTVTVTLETPLKEDRLSRDGLRFFDPLPTATFFRGTVRLRYSDDQGVPRTRYVHLVQRRGQQGEPLVTLEMPAGDRRLVEFSFLYPPDSTPPQVLTVRTLEGGE